jgi:hypothetical protein
MKNFLAWLLFLTCTLSFGQVINPPHGGGGCTTCVLRAGDTMTGNLILSGGALQAPVTGFNFYGDANNAVIDMYTPGATVDKRRMAQIFGGNAFQMAFVDDNVTAVSAWILVVGDSTGTTSISFPSTAPVSTGGDLSVTGNLTAATGAIPVMSITGTLVTSPKTVKGSATLSAGSATVDLTGNAIFTSSSSYVCIANDTANAAVLTSTQNQSSSQFKIFGTLTDTVTFLCTGN